MSAATTMELYQRASGGDREALTEYAMRLMEGVDCERNEKNAVQCLVRAVEMGSGEAAAQLGRCYACGIGVKQNDENATKCFRKGAELGDPESMYRLFLNLSLGVGCGKNLDEADAWLEKAKAAGYSKAKTMWDNISSAGMLNESMAKECPTEAELSECRRLSENSERITASMISPNNAYAIAVGDEGGSAKIHSQTFIQNVGGRVTAFIMVIYALAGLLSGYLMFQAVSVRNSVSILGARRIFNYTHNSVGIMVLYLVLGLLLGLLLGFLISKMYKKTAMSIMYYLPALAFPLLLAGLGWPAMAAAMFIGKLLYYVLSAVVGLFALYCVCASSGGG